jgi:hypothetical protein
MANLSKKRGVLAGRGADLKVTATASGLDIQAVSPRASTAGAQLKVAYAAGAAANTNITISGIKTSDVLVSVLEIQPPTATSGNTIVADRTAATTIYATNTIRISENTTGNQVLVLWWSV